MNAVETLWCNNNQISDLPAFMDQVQTKFPFLTALSLMRNPACPGYDELSMDASEANRRYRLYVIFRMPSLAFLDCSPVTENEKKEALRAGKYCAARRPALSQMRRARGARDDAATATVDDVIARVRQDQRKLGRGSTTFVSRRPDSSSGPFMRKKTGSIRGVRGDTFERGRHSEGNRFIGDSDL
jgi:stalled ribosome alternative rescue factor ArfA